MLPLLSSHLGPLNNLVRNATHRRTVHTETALRNAIFKLIQERDAAFLIVNVDAHSLGCNFWVSLELSSKGVVVGCEEAEGANVRGDVVQDGLGDSHTVVGAGTATQFVEDDK